MGYIVLREIDLVVDKFCSVHLRELQRAKRHQTRDAARNRIMCLPDALYRGRHAPAGIASSRITPNTMR